VWGHHWGASRCVCACVCFCDSETATSTEVPMGHGLRLPVKCQWVTVSDCQWDTVPVGVPPVGVPVGHCGCQPECGCATDCHCQWVWVWVCHRLPVWPTVRGIFLRHRASVTAQVKVSLAVPGAQGPGPGVATATLRILERDNAQRVCWLAVARLSLSQTRSRHTHAVALR